MAGAKVIRKLKATRVYETDSCSCVETLSASREADLGVNRWRTNILFLRARKHAAWGPDLPAENSISFAELYENVRTKTVFRTSRHSGRDEKRKRKEEENSEN